MVFKKIKGFENYYISNTGILINSSNKILRTRLDKDGYEIARLFYKVKVFYKKVHRLVLIAFEGENCLRRIVNHKDGNKTNNKLDNLEWATTKENVQHMYRTGLKKIGMHYNCGEKAHKAKLNKEIVLCIRKSNENALFLSEKYGVTRNTIYYILNNKTWKGVV